MKKKYTCKLAKIAICIFTIASTCTKNDSRHNIKGENPQNSKSENEFPESEHEYPKSVHNSEQNNDTPLSNSGSHSGRYGFLDNKKSEESLNAEAAIGVLCYDDNDFFENLIGNSFNARNTSPGKSNMHFTGLPLTKANQTFFISNKNEPPYNLELNDTSNFGNYNYYLQPILFPFNQENYNQSPSNMRLDYNNEKSDDYNSQLLY